MAERWAALCDTSGRYDPPLWRDWATPDWQTQASCTDQQRKFWLGEYDYDADRYTHPESWVKRARTVCLRCPVRPECLAQELDVMRAVLNSDDPRVVRFSYGIFGGTSAKDREAIVLGEPVKVCSGCGIVSVEGAQHSPCVVGSVS